MPKKEERRKSEEFAWPPRSAAPGRKQQVNPETLPVAPEQEARKPR